MLSDAHISSSGYLWSFKGCQFTIDEVLQGACTIFSIAASDLWKEKGIQIYFGRLVRQRLCNMVLR